MPKINVEVRECVMRAGAEARDSSGRTAREKCSVAPEHLDGAAVSLRSLQPSDWPLELALAHDTEASRWIDYPANMDVKQAQDRIATAKERAAEGFGSRYAIVNSDQTTIGTCGVVLDGSTPMVSYALLPQGRGRGAATAAVRMLTEWAFAEGHAIVALEIADGNVASEGVARRAGFVPAGSFEEDQRGTRTRVTRWERCAKTGYEPADNCSFVRDGRAQGS